MSAAVVPWRCVPDDFINPFLPWAWTATVCALFLIAEAAALGSAIAGVARAGWGRAVRRLLSGLLVVLVAVIALAGAFTAWSWVWGMRFRAWCKFMGQGQFEQQQLDAADRVAAWGHVVLAGTIIALLIGAALVLVATAATRQRVRGTARMARGE